MKAHVQLLEYIIDMWDPDQDNFVVGVHIMPIEIEDIYFLTSLSMRGSPVVLSGARGGEGSFDDILISIAHWVQSPNRASEKSSL